MSASGAPSWAAGSLQRRPDDRRRHCLPRLTLRRVMPRHRDRPVIRSLGKSFTPSMVLTYSHPALSESIEILNYCLIYTQCLGMTSPYPGRRITTMSAPSTVRSLRDPRSWRMGGASCRRPRTASSVGNPTPSIVKPGSGNCGKCGN